MTNMFFKKICMLGHYISSCRFNFIQATDSEIWMQ